MDGEARLEVDGNGGASLQSLIARSRHSLLLLVPRTVAATNAKQMEGTMQMEEGGAAAEDSRRLGRRKSRESGRQFGKQCRGRKAMVIEP